VIAKVLDFVREEQRLLIREVAEELGIYRGSWQANLTDDLALRYVSVSFHLMAADSGAEVAPLVCYFWFAVVFRNGGRFILKLTNW